MNTSKKGKIKGRAKIRDRSKSARAKIGALFKKKKRNKNSQLEKILLILCRAGKKKVR
jgi:hypothetical protein